MDSPPLTTLAGDGRVGVLADTHCEAAGRRLPAAVFDAFAGVRLIVHLGDCGDTGALDALARVAPVIATRGGDDRAQDERYADTRVVRVAELSVGTLFDLASTGITVRDGRIVAASSAGVERALLAAFGRRIDVVCFAATHAPLVAHIGGTLFVNPGSATLPAPPGPPTVAILNVTGAVASVDIHRL